MADKKNKAVKALRFSCGCGFNSKIDKEAVKHSEQTGHCLTVLGTIRKA